MRSVLPNFVRPARRLTGGHDAHGSALSARNLFASFPPFALPHNGRKWPVPRCGRAPRLLPRRKPRLQTAKEKPINKERDPDVQPQDGADAGNRGWLAPLEAVVAARLILNVGRKSELEEMSDQHTKVIGCFAYSSSKAVVCSGKACVVSGSEVAMRNYISELNPQGAASHTVRKTRFGEIMQGLRLGAAYAFDEESYGRFLPLGRAEGLALEEADFNHGEHRFFTVQVKPQ